MLFQIYSLLLMFIFYGCYFLKMLKQKQQGIKTIQLGKDKKGYIRFIEIAMELCSVVLPIVEFVSIITIDKSNILVQTIGAVIATIGVVVFIMSVITMRDNWRAGISQTDKTELVTDEIYGISRNPAFLGFDLLYIGILCMFYNWTLLILTFITLVIFHIQIVYVEERFLISNFGEEYQNYKNKVNRYLGKNRKNYEEEN